MKIYVEKRPAELEEKAYWDGMNLFIHYHQFTKELYDYTDARKLILLTDIETVTMIFGSRGGFKRLVIKHRGEEFVLSNNHKRLCIQVYKCMRQVNFPVIKQVQKRGDD